MKSQDFVYRENKWELKKNQLKDGVQEFDIIVDVHNSGHAMKVTARGDARRSPMVANAIMIVEGTCVYKR